MAEEFRTEAILSVRADESSIRDTQSQIEDMLGPATVEATALPSGRFTDRLQRQVDNDPPTVTANVETDTGGGDRPLDALAPDGGTGGLTGDLGGMEQELTRQTDILDESRDTLIEILDTLEEGGGAGGAGAGGGGLLGGLLGGSGLLATILGKGRGALGKLGGGLRKAGGLLKRGARTVGGVAKRGASRLGGLARSGLSRLAPLASAPAAGVAIGLTGAGIMDKLGIDDAIQNLGQDVREGLPGGDMIGDLAQFLPSASVGAAVPEIGSGLIDLASGVVQAPGDILSGKRGFLGSFESAAKNFEEGVDKFSQVWQQRAGVLENVATTGINAFEAGGEKLLSMLGLGGGATAVDRAGRRDNRNDKLESTSRSEIVGSVGSQVNQPGGISDQRRQELVTALRNTPEGQRRRILSSTGVSSPVFQSIAREVGIDLGGTAVPTSKPSSLVGAAATQTAPGRGGGGRSGQSDGGDTTVNVEARFETPATEFEGVIQEELARLEQRLNQRVDQQVSEKTRQATGPGFSIQ